LSEAAETMRGVAATEIANRTSEARAGARADRARADEARTSEARAGVGGSAGTSRSASARSWA